MVKEISYQRFDIDIIRKDFNVLSETVYNKRLSYLDNAASTQKPKCVINAIFQAYNKNYSNVHRATHYLSNASTEAYENARETVRKFLNAPSPETIIFTGNATAAINTVSYGWGMSHIERDDEIIITIMEHHSNFIPWHFIREKKGAKIVFLYVDKYGIFHIEDLEKSITKRTRLIAITHMSNVLGTICPLKEIIEIAHSKNIPVLVDGSQGAVHFPVDVLSINCDWYVMTGHKLYGPTGIGVLYGKKTRLNEMDPFHGGGEMVEDVQINNVNYNCLPYKFEAGTPPIVQAIGLAAAIKYLEKIGRNNIIDYEKQINLYAHQRLKEIHGIEIIGNDPNKGGIISFILSGIHPHDLSIFSDRKGVAIRAGTHCAQPLLKYFNKTSVCRASLSFYNNKDDIDQLVDSLKEAKAFFSAK